MPNLYPEEFGCVGRYVATSVYKGPKPDFEFGPLDSSPRLQAAEETHKVQVFELYEDPAGTGAYTSGRGRNIIRGFVDASVLHSGGRSKHANYLYYL